LNNFQEAEEFLKKCEEYSAKRKQIKTHKRYLIVLPKMVGMKIGVHNGKGFQFFDVIPEMLGHRFGEFSLTRNKVKHSSAGVGATKGSKSKSKK
jgi:small subunit ribosomal protein S19